MKKKLFIFLTIASLSVIIYSCSKEPVGNEEKNNPSTKLASSTELVSSLQRDIRFINVVNANMKIINRTKKSKELITLVSKKDPSMLDLEKISVLLGFKNFNEYSEYVKKQNVILLHLKEEYQLKNVSQTVIQQAAIEAMKPNKISSMKVLESSGSEGGSPICEQIRRNCLIGVAAAATAAHITCIGVDPTVILGLICHAAAIAYQVVQGDNCNLEAQQCNGGIS